MLELTHIYVKVIGTRVKACFAKIEKMISASGGDSLLPGELEPHAFKKKKLRFLVHL